MKKAICASAFAFAAMLLGPSAYAADDIAACKSIKDPTQRLECFDRATAPHTVAEGRNMDVTDFLVDAKELAGKKVSVEGVAQAFAGMILLKKELIGTDFATVQIDKVSRPQRKALLEKCGEGCDAVVRGVARLNYGQKIIQADEIEIRN